MGNSNSYFKSKITKHAFDSYSLDLLLPSLTKENPRYLFEDAISVLTSKL
jgi:recombinational DNA repair protein (RecF pathway)